MTWLLLITVAVVVWTLLASGERFLRGFARLLTEPAIQQGAFSLLSGRSSVTGKFKDRDVAVRLQRKRNRHGQGYLVVAIRAGREPALDYDGVEARTRDDSGRRALGSVAAHDLRLSVEEGWLTARWQPQGFVIFPGRFSEEKWRQVLEAMQTLATSLESGA